MFKTIQRIIEDLNTKGIKPTMTSDELMNLTRDTPLPKPSMKDLMIQIKDWESETKKEIELHDRKESAKLIASKLL